MLMHQGYAFNRRSGHIQESINECINKRNNESMFLSRARSPPTPNQSIKINLKRIMLFWVHQIWVQCPDPLFTSCVTFRVTSLNLSSPNSKWGMVTARCKSQEDQLETRMKCLVLRNCSGNGEKDKPFCGCVSEGLPCPPSPHPPPSPQPPNSALGSIPQSLPGVFKVMPGVSEKSLIFELRLMYYGRGLTSWWGCRKPRILTAVLWIPSKRRLMGHQEGRGQCPQCRLPCTAHSFSSGGGAGLVLKT